MGFYGIYKPVGCTSHDIVSKLRKITGIKKIGHAGTLDPLAEGVLVVAIGKNYTRKIKRYQNAEKEYYAEVEFGKTSDTDDREGIIHIKQDINPPSEDKVRTVLKTMEGYIKQIPPVYSAIKIKGIPSYKLARQGEKPQLAPRTVYIKKIYLTDYKYPKLSVTVITSSGVYIRALARDLGKKLSTGGVLIKLIRTRVGDVDLKNCLTLQEFKKNLENKE